MTDQTPQPPPVGESAALMLTRDVLPDECPWLRSPRYEGSVVFRFRGTTYGCIDYEKGVACCDHADGLTGPFFEMPRDALGTLSGAGVL